MPEQAKSARKTFIIVVVAIVIAVAAIGFACLKLKYASDKQKEYEKDFLRALGYQQDAWIRSENAHDNYTNNPIAMSLFSNITTSYPFLVAQTRILLADMDVLTNNITVPNYYVAFKQYLLCKIINKAYDMNSSKYFVVIRNFTWMDYNSYEDVAYFTDEPPTSNIRIGNEGYWVCDYTSTLNEVDSKLDFISGVLDKIYTG